MEAIDPYGPQVNQNIFHAQFTIKKALLRKYKREIRNGKESFLFEEERENITFFFPLLAMPYQVLNGEDPIDSEKESKDESKLKSALKHRHSKFLRAV